MQRESTNLKCCGLCSFKVDPQWHTSSEKIPPNLSQKFHQLRTEHLNIWAILIPQCPRWHLSFYSLVISIKVNITRIISAIFLQECWKLCILWKFWYLFCFYLIWFCFCLVGPLESRDYQAGLDLVILHRAATTDGDTEILCTMPFVISLLHILEHNLSEINISQITSDLTFRILFLGVFWFIINYFVIEINSSHLSLAI